MAKRGFTLIELLVVISIIALLSSVVLGSLNAAREKGRIAAARQFAGSAYRAGADSALGVWDFDESSGTTTADRSGNGNSGTFMGGATQSSDTQSGMGYSVSLDGSGDYVSTALSRSDRSALTAMAWFKYEGSAAAGYRPIFGGASQDFFVGKVTGNTNVGVQDGVYRGNMGSGTNAWDGSWHHIAYVWNGSTGTVYLDGAQLASASFTGGTGAIYIGYEAEGSGYYFQGKIDEARILEKTLTAAEVGRAYAAGRERHAVAAAARQGPMVE